MQDIQTAALISVIAIVLSAVSLGWNVYRDVILKPRVKVRASVRALVHLGINNSPPIRLIVTAVNFGPGDVYCQSVLAKNAHLLRRVSRRAENWFVLHETPQLPQKLAVGQPLDVMIPYKEGDLLTKPITHLGIADSFGRVHWVPRRNVKEVLAQYKKDFGSKVGATSAKPT